MYSEIFSKVYDAFGWNYYPESFAQLLLKWIGLAETFRRQYLLHKNVLYRLSDFYKRQGVRLFLMKKS